MNGMEKCKTLKSFLLLFLHLNLFMKACRPLWTLASNMIFLLSPRPCSMLPVFHSYHALYIHLLRYLRILPVPPIVAVALCFGMPWFCSLSISLYHFSWRDVVNFSISLPCNISFISSFEGLNYQVLFRGNLDLTGIKIIEKLGFGVTLRDEICCMSLTNESLLCESCFTVPHPNENTKRCHSCNI